MMEYPVAPDVSKTSAASDGGIGATNFWSAVISPGKIAAASWVLRLTVAGAYGESKGLSVAATTTDEAQNEPRSMAVPASAGPTERFQVLSWPARSEPNRIPTARRPMTTEEATIQGRTPT
jgi:hypothetical protein